MTITPGALDYAITRGQLAMRGLYTDRCKVTRVARPADAAYVDVSQIDPVTLQRPEQARVVVYQGPCRMQVKADINSNVVETTAGEREWTYLTAQFQLPLTVDEARAIVLAVGDDPDADPTKVIGNPYAVATDHVVDYLSCPYNEAMVGRQFNVAGPYHKSHAVYLRFRVREVVA